MPTLTAAKVIRRVRQRLEISQEALSRLLNATKGAVQHWERGRNNPDLARLLALRQLCPPGAERKELDALIKQVQAEVAPLPTLGQALPKKGAQLPPAYPSVNLLMLRRENNRLRKQVDKLQATLQRRSEQMRILEGLAADQQRQIAELKAGGKTLQPQSTAAAAPE